MLKLAESMPIFFHYPWTGPSVWKPHRDGHYAAGSGVDSVLPDEPYRLLRSGRFHRVPLIIGANSDEGILNVIGYLNGQSKLDEVEERWDQLGPLILFHRCVRAIQLSATFFFPKLRWPSTLHAGVWMRRPRKTCEWPRKLNDSTLEAPHFHK